KQPCPPTPRMPPLTPSIPASAADPASSSSLPTPSPTSWSFFLSAPTSSTWECKDIEGSHSDVFTYHMAVMEMVGVLGSISNCLGAILANTLLLKIGLYFCDSSTNGQIPFHILTCVERHLAVVHPITYLRLRNRGGIMIRNVSIAFVWLLFFTWITVSTLIYSMAPYFCITIFSMVVVMFCSLSVLRALIRPGPGEGGGDKVRLGQSKKRAFYTIMAIMLTLCFRFGGQLLLLSMFVSMDL
ncbi:hypothetical protein JOQ06_020232, partial [Pogonophryne albipinna]